MWMEEENKKKKNKIVNITEIIKSYEKNSKNVRILLE